MARFLRQQHRKWWAVLDIPKDVRPVFDQAKFNQNLNTESKTEAERLVLSVVSGWKLAIKKAREKNTIEALAMIERNKRNDMSPEGAEVYDEFVLTEIAEEIEARKGIKDAKRFYDMASGQRTPLTEYQDQWLKDADINEKQEDMYRSDLRQLNEEYKTIEDIDRKAAKAFVASLLNNVKPKTVKRKLSVYRGYWGWLQHHDIIDEEKAIPWDNIKLPKHKQVETRPFKDEGLERIIEACKITKDKQVLDLVYIGMFTGARIEELCSLKLTDIHDGYFTIVEAKTDAGLRDVPIHSMIKHLVTNLMEGSRDGFLMSGLTSNKYSHRAGAIGTRFGRLKASLGFAPRSEVFHSIRGSVAQKLKDHKVNEFIAADVLGHEYQTMTYGLYSGSADVEVKKEALEKISYPFLLTPLA